MPCIKCGKREVIVVSECWQRATLRDDMLIDDYGPVEEVLDNIVEVRCADPECDADLSAVAKIN